MVAARSEGGGVVTGHARHQGRSRSKAKAPVRLDKVGIDCLCFFVEVEQVPFIIEVFGPQAAARVLVGHRGFHWLSWKLRLER